MTDTKKIPPLQDRHGRYHLHTYVDGSLYRRLKGLLYATNSGAFCDWLDGAVLAECLRMEKELGRRGA